MAPEEIQALADKISENLLHGKHVCRLTIDTETHRLHHDAVHSFIEAMNKISDIKWAALKAVVIALIFAGLAIMGMKLE